jgi:hypothetical protein
VIIRDVSGKKLQLSDEILSEVESINHFYVFLREFRLPRELPTGKLLTYGSGRGRWAQLRTSDDPDGGNWCVIPMLVKKRKVGCREFDPKTFAHILKAAGIKRAKKSVQIRTK